MASSSSALGAASNTSASHDVLIRAYKAEIQQLKDTLHELSVRDSSSGSPGFSEVLEGKYLAQIKRNKTLSVQLGTAQQQLADAQRALQTEQEKTKRLVAATTAMAAGVAAPGANAGRRGGKNVRDAANVDGEDEDGGGGGGKSADAASSAVQRAYDQLHQKEIALAEVQRENAALRTLVQREVGLRDDMGEVDELLKRSSTAAAPAGSGASAGWRGRAEEIVVLRGKLKDAQRRVEAVTAAEAAAAAAASALAENGNDDASAYGGGSSGADPLGLPASVRAYLGMPEDANGETRSALTGATTTTALTTTTAARRKDVDDVARDRLTALQQQRAAQQRQQAIDAQQQQRQLAEEKLRSAALQARITTMKTELDALRSHVETILDKSASDDELLDAYKVEVQRAQEEARAWQVKANAATTASAQAQSAALSGVKNAAAAAMASAAARSAPYRNAAQSVEATAAFAAEERNNNDDKKSNNTALSMQNVDGVVYDWVLRACEDSPAAVVKGRSSISTAVPATESVAAVLRSALRHVAQVERQATAAAAVVSTGDATAKADDKLLSGPAATAPQVEKVLLTENAALKKRIRALTDMMEREMQAQKVLWSSRDAHPDPNGGE